MVEQKVLFGGLVADAATMPVHWIYDLNKLKEVLGEEGLQKPEFHSPSATPFYSPKEYPGHYEIGQLSVYGEQTVAVLEYFAETKGKFDPEGFAQFLYAWFKKYTGRLDHATKEFLEKGDKLKGQGKNLFPDAGADDDQAQHTFKLPVLFLVPGISSELQGLLKVSADIVRAHQNKDLTVNFGKMFSFLLSNLMSVDSERSSPIKKMETAITSALSSEHLDEMPKFYLQKAWGAKTNPNLDATGWDTDLQTFGKELSHELCDKFGGKPEFKDFYAMTCVFPGAFVVSLKIIGDTLIRFQGDEAAFANEGYAFGVRRNILFGGDNCGRSFLVGCLLTALGCEVPASFMQKFSEKEIIGKMIKSL